MSARHMLFVFDHAPEDWSDGTVLVALALADHFHIDRDDYAWPSVERIAHRARRNVRNTIAALARLERDGWIVRHYGQGAGRNGQKTTRYEWTAYAGRHRALVDNSPTPVASDTPTPVASDTPSRRTPVASDTPTPVASDTPTPVASDTLNRKKEPEVRTGTKEPPSRTGIGVESQRTNAAARPVDNPRIVQPPLVASVPTSRPPRPPKPPIVRGDPSTYPPALRASMERDDLARQRGKAKPKRPASPAALTEDAAG